MTTLSRFRRSATRLVLLAVIGLAAVAVVVFQVQNFSLNNKVSLGFFWWTWYAAAETEVGTAFVVGAIVGVLLWKFGPALRRALRRDHPGTPIAH
jgi:uncharacterized integral membrane protein